jgi:hypothetical protein
MRENRQALDMHYAPLSRERWLDFEELFDERDAVGGCWCMWWRIKRSEYERQKGAGNRQAMKTIRAGFVECPRRSETRPIMRYYL